MKVRLDSSICLENSIEPGDVIIKDSSTYIVINIDPITIMDLDECNISQSRLFTYEFRNFNNFQIWLDFDYKLFPKNIFEFQLVEKES